MRQRAIIVGLLCVTMLWANPSSPIRIGLLLPLQAEVSQRDMNMDRFVDFYTGALMAVYEMQETGQEIEVYTFDVGKTTYRLAELVNSDTLNRMDMIVGPVYPAQVRQIASWTLRHHVPVLLPFANEVPELAYNPYLLQFNSSNEAEADAIIHSVVADSVQFVFVESGETAVPTSVKELIKGVHREGLDYVYTSIQQIMTDSLSEVLNDSVENILVMNTERYANIRQVMPYLRRAADHKPLTLLTRYAWQEESISLPHLYATVFHRDVEVDSIHYGALYRRFVAQPRAVSLPCYDLLGYDMMTYVLETIAIHRQLDNPSWQEVIEREFVGVQSDMHFVRVSDIGGYQNSHIQIIRSE